jgi:hypothetical protein
VSYFTLKTKYRRRAGRTGHIPACRRSRQPSVPSGNAHHRRSPMRRRTKRNANLKCPATRRQYTSQSHSSWRATIAFHSTAAFRVPRGQWPEWVANRVGSRPLEGRPFKASELTLPTLTNASERCQKRKFESDATVCRRDARQRLPLTSTLVKKTISEELWSQFACLCWGRSAMQGALPASSCFDRK